jgi:hypothetical protein
VKKAMLLNGVGIFVLLCLFFLAGCSYKPEVGQKIAEDGARNQATLKLKLMLPEEAGPASIRAQTSVASATVRVTLLMLDPASPQRKVEIRKTFSVSEKGEAEIIFSALPMATLAADLQIVNGRVGDHSLFLGAIDLVSGENTLAMAPKDSRMIEEIAARALLSAFNNAELIVKLNYGVAGHLMQTLTYADTTSSDIYDDTLNSLVALGETQSGKFSFRTVVLHVPYAETSELPPAGTASFLDKTGNTHIAWTGITGTDTFNLYYSMVSASGEVRQMTKITNDESLQYCPDIIVDDSGIPHIAYFLKRDRNGSIQSGNYATMYAAGSRNASGTIAFSVSQVSKNPTESTVDNDDIFNCWVNDRPQIGFDVSGNLVITYLSDGSKLTSYNNYLIEAKLTGGNWTRRQLFSPDLFDLPSPEGAYLNFSHTRYNCLRKRGQADMIAAIEINQYTPLLWINNGSGFSMTAFTEMQGTFRNQHPQIDSDPDGAVRFQWYDKQVKQFCHVKFTGGQAGQMTTFAAPEAAGNLQPATIDQINGSQYLFYSFFDGDSGMLISIDAAGVASEVMIPGIGSPRGANTLEARNGFISLVTASKSQKAIYVTLAQHNAR